MRREVTGVDLLLMLVVFAASTGTFACALVALFDGRDALALAFAAGGLSLGVWAGLRGNGRLRRA